MHGNISVKFYKVISNIFKNKYISFLAHSARGALRIVIKSVTTEILFREFGKIPDTNPRNPAIRGQFVPEGLARTLHTEKV